MRKFKVAAAIFGLGLGFAAAAPAAHASTFNLSSHKEGEVDVGLGCLDESSCMTINGMTITSLDPIGDFGKSRLFFDKKGTANNYGDGEVIFGETDTGTTEKDDELRLRSVAYDKDGNAKEGGELEVGRYLVEFAEAIDVDLSFFDTEGKGTGIFEINGDKNSKVKVKAGKDGNYQTVSLTNVTSFIMQVGNYTSFRGAGDGVTISAFETSKEFAVADVPEPTTTLSLGALAVAGMFGAKKGKKSK